MALSNFNKDSAKTRFQIRGGGETGDLFRSIDWSKHPLGPLETWPVALKISLNNLFHSKQPMFIWWGKDLYQFYNDAMTRVMDGGKHPQAMGQSGNECWPEIWPRVKPQIDQVMSSGQSTCEHSPIFNEDGTIGGILAICTDATHFAFKEKYNKEIKPLKNEDPEKIHALLRQTPFPLVMLEGPEHRFKFANLLYEKYFLGNQEYIGKTVTELIPEAEVQGFIALLDNVYQTGERYVGNETFFEFIPPNKEPKKHFYFNFVYEPIKNIKGEVEGVLAAIADVTDQVLARTRWEETDKNLSLALESGQMGTWNISLETNEVQISPKAAAILGLTKISGDISELLFERTHPDDRNETRRIWSESIRDKKPFSCEYRILRADGKVRWVLSRGSAQCDESQATPLFSGLIMDITDQKKVQSRLQTALDTVPVFAGFLNERGVVVLVNQAAADIIEETKENILGKYFWECAWWKDQPEIIVTLKEALAQAAKGVSHRFDTQYTAIINGQPHVRWVDLSLIAILKENGEVEEISASGFDITERIEQAKELLAAKASAENANATKSAFLANMSHEIRTPLGAILGFTDVLRTSVVSKEEHDHYLEIITKNGQALVKIIDDILDLSKIEAGKLSIEHTPVCLSEVTQDILAMFSDRAAGKGIQLKFDAAGFPKFKISSDAVRIRQVLVNLIGNGIKFTSEGSVTVHCGFKEMENDNAKISLFVTDTGIGMTDEQATMLFKPFTQGDEKSSRRYGGTGLGLALSRKLGHALGGNVSLKNYKAGEGCTFKFEIVAKKCGSWETTIGPASPDYGQSKKGRLQGVKVLVVDDSPDNRTLIDVFLQREGASIDQAASGEQGVQMALKDIYDTVLMDIQMPGIDGYEALARLRRENFRKPIIALTAHAMKEERNRVLASGFSDHIPKPVNHEQLVESILSHIRRVH